MRSNPSPRRPLSGPLHRGFLPAAAGLLLFVSPLAAIDENSDGYDDLWQTIHGVTPAGFPHAEDFDGDGASNLEEDKAGTNPRNPGDHLRVRELAVSTSGASVTFDSAAGKRYRVISSDSPEGLAWTPEGTPGSGTGSLATISFERGSADRRFYRVLAEDLDSDNDGASDWHEAVLGTNPGLSHSPNNASDGVASDGEVLRGLLGLQVEVIAAEAHETPLAPARLRFTRSDATAPLRLPLSLFGAADPKRGSASSADYSLDGADEGFVELPAGQAQYEVAIEPVADSVEEVPETLRLRFARPGIAAWGGDLEAEVRILDQPRLAENQRLFVAYLTPPNEVDSGASGVLTALVEGDNASAVIALRFSNLSSDQNTAYLRTGENLEVSRIPNGQVSAHAWPIEAAAILPTDQATLDALEAGGLFVSVSSGNYPDGEIRGTLQRAEGSISEAAPPADPPSYGDPEFPNLAAEGVEDNPELDRDIARFLTQASFGPTPESIAEVRAFVAASGNNALAGYEAWIDDQIANVPNPSLKTLVEAADVEEFILRGNKPSTAYNDPQFGGNSTQFNATTRTWVPSSIHQNNHPFHSNRRQEWWTLVLNARSQLRQRMAFALSEIVVISEMDTTVTAYHYGAARYWDQLAENAFSPYRKVLEDVTYSPMMGIYLSHLKNQKRSSSISPDENFAREIMQLFSIGLVLRHPDGTLRLDPVEVLPIPAYDQGDITEMARVMTGLSFGKRHANNTGAVQDNTSFTQGNGHRYWSASWTNPMKMFSGQHDFNGYTAYTGQALPQGVTAASKILFRGKPGQKVIPVRSASDANGLADIADALDALAGSTGPGAWDGHPNTPVFVSRLLIQRFTTSNPSRAYLHRVATVFRETKGNLGAVVKAILLDQEVRIPPAGGTPSPADAPGAGKVKEPLLHFTALLRGLGYRSRAPIEHLATMPVPFTAAQSPVTTPYPASELAKFPAGATRFRFFDMTGALTQSPQRAPSVFNWFLPDYVFPGPLGAAGLVAPELQVATESNVVSVVNQYWSNLFSRMEPSPISEQEYFTGFRYGRGVNNFFNLSLYRNASGVQLSVPAYGRPHDPATNPNGRGYFLRAKFDENAAFPDNSAVLETPTSIDDQHDNLLLDVVPLEARYTAAYLASLAEQFDGAGNVPAAPGDAEKRVAHDAAAEALLDHFDLLLAGGYLRAKYGASPSSGPRQAILDALASDRIGSRTLHTDHASYRTTIGWRIKNLAYFVATSPQALVLH